PPVRSWAETGPAPGRPPDRRRYPGCPGSPGSPEWSAAPPAGRGHPRPNRPGRRKSPAHRLFPGGA
ncbi:hypothetical protein HEAFMP_HEAFMP_12580, partial [Dysosmobacter welbionis]